MAQSANLYLDEGATGANVDVQDGIADQETAVLTYEPPRGTFIRLLNMVAAGSSAGLPLFLKLKDNGDADLPVNTTVYIAVRRAGQSAWHRISEEITNIGHYIRTDLTTQQDADNIDASKVELRYPEASGQTGSPSSTKVRDIDEVAVIVKSAVALNTDTSVIQLSTDAVEGPHSR